ncbi:MAG: MMPL family transporter [Thermoplasmatota archaeon]
MLKQLGGFIERKPSMVVLIVLLITIGFALFIPSIEFKTDISEFMPDDEITYANERVNKYFGLSSLPIFALVENNKEPSVNTAQSLRDLYTIEQQISNHPDVERFIGITTFLNPVCMIQFGKTIEECTDEEIQIAFTDMIIDIDTKELKIFPTDYPNDPVVYKRFPGISKAESVPSADIKNCYISKDEHSMFFTFEVTDLSNLHNNLRPTLSKVNIMEWYLEFENLIKPDEILDITYQLSAHIEPTHRLWVLGRGVLPNIREILHHIRNRELLTSYTMEAYLWITPAGESISFPIPLSTAIVSLRENTITIEVSRSELAKYGIAPQIGWFELPAKLSQFRAGVRYYQRGLLRQPGGRISAQTEFLIERLEKIRNRPVLGTFAAKILQNMGDLTWEDFDELFELLKQTDMIPETFALHDINSNWIEMVDEKNSKISTNEFFIIPFLFEDLKLNAIGFLSKDFTHNGAAQATLIIIQLDLFDMDYSEMLRLNREIFSLLEELDQKLVSVSIQATGELEVTSQINDLTLQANQILGPAMFVIIIFILFISFRKTSYIILPLVSLLIAMIWLVGTMILLGITFNVIAVALIPLILGLGVDYSVHFLHNYRAELKKGNSSISAIKKSINEIGVAIFLAWITTVIAFMSFLSSSMIPIRQFGILLAFGITYTFICSITFLPALRYLIDRKKNPDITIKLNGLSSKFSLSKIMGALSLLVISNKKKILVIMVLLTIVFGVGASQLERGFDLNQFVPRDDPSMELFSTLVDYFPYASEGQEYYLIEGNVATVQVLEGIAQTHKNAQDDTFVARNPDGTVKVNSIYSEIQLAIKNNNSLIEAFNINEQTGIPRTDADVKALFDYLYKGQSLDLEDFETEDIDIIGFSTAQIEMVLYQSNQQYTATVIRYHLDSGFRQTEGNIQKNLEILSEELSDNLANYGEGSVIITGNAQIQLSNTTNLTSSQFLSTAISLLLAAIVLIIAYRNISLGLITMIPVCSSIVWILGTMYFLGYILDVLTVTVTSITIGIGIDYSIHATERFRLITKKTGNIEQAVYETIFHTGGALLIAGLTTALAFGILILAPIPPQQRFGIILALTIFYSLITTILMLPIILEKWANWRKNKKGYIITKGPIKDKEA